MGLSITVLGCGGTYAGAGNECSGYLLRSTGEGTAVWLDCGPGTLANLQEFVSIEDLAGVVVSHSHPDHWMDLAILRNALRFGSGRRDLPVYGTADTLARVEAAVGDAVAPTFDWHVLDETMRPEIGPLVFRFSRTDHPVETLAVRVDEDGASIGYSADTGPGWAIAGLGEGIDVMVCEATLPDHLAGTAPHLSGGQAGRSARDAGVGRLVVTHVWPTFDPEDHRAEAAAAFGGDVGLATPRARFDT